MVIFTICRSIQLEPLKILPVISGMSGKLSGIAFSSEALVNRLTMLVTAEGEWMLEDSAEFRAALGDPEPDYDAPAFAVKNLGFIKFQMLDNSIIEIELHPRNVKLPALLAIQQQLLSSQVKLFRIKYFDTSWKSEIMCASELAVSRLSELCAPVFAPSCSERFVAEPRDYATLFNDSESSLGLLAQKWRMSLGTFDPTVISFAIKHQLLSRLMIFGVKPTGGDPIFRFIGDGFKWLGTDYKLFGVGQRVENQPDKDYGGWVSGFYKNVATSGQPRYDHVTAGIRLAPDEPKLFVSRYERLLLPWKTPSDEVFVSMLSRPLADGSGRAFDTADPENSWSKVSLKSS
jgi:hypothetical protein